MKKIDIKFIAYSAIIAALYVALTWGFAPISYGPVQFRISEVLMLLIILNPKYSFSLVLGCFIANTTSSLGWYDMVFGTMATLLAVIPMCFTKKLYIGAIFPVITNMFIVSWELGLAFDMWGGAYWYNVFTVGLGEAVVLYLLGIPTMLAVTKNEFLVEKMELRTDAGFKFIPLDRFKISSIALGVLGVILFIAYPFYTQTVGEEVNQFSPYSIAMDGNYWLWIIGILPVIYTVVYLFTKSKIKLISTNAINFLLLITFILAGVFVNECLGYAYYYIYIVYIFALVLLPVVDYLTERNNNIEIAEENKTEETEEEIM